MRWLLHKLFGFEYILVKSTYANIKTGEKIIRIESMKVYNDDNSGKKFVISINEVVFLDGSETWLYRNKK